MRNLKVMLFVPGNRDDFFGKVELVGVDVGSNYGAARPAYTKDAIASMSASEINKNWDMIKDGLV